MTNTGKPMTVRLPRGLHQRLERLAVSIGRSMPQLAVDALHDYVERNEWQVAQIKAGIHEADAGDFASDVEVAAVIAKWTGEMEPSER